MNAKHARPADAAVDDPLYKSAPELLDFVKMIAVWVDRGEFKRDASLIAGMASDLAARAEGRK